MPAPASGRSPSLTSPSTAAPRRWPGARVGVRTPCWAGCTPTMPRVLTRSRSAAPAAAVPFLPAAPSRTRRGGLRRPAHGGHPPPRRGRPRAALDVAPLGRLGARALRPGVLSRDDPDCSAPPQAVVEESQKAAGTGRSRAATSVHRAAPERAGGRPTRPAFGGLSRRGAPPPGRGSRLRLGRAWPAVMDRLPLAGSVRTRLLLWALSLLLWALSLQRRSGAAVALPARQRRAHRRGSSTAAGRMARSQADRAVGRRALSPGPGRPGDRPHVGHRTDAAAGLQS